MRSKQSQTGSVSHLLLLIPSTSYRTTDYVAAARALGLGFSVGSDHRQVLVDDDRGLYLSFNSPARAARRIIEFAARVPLTGIVGTDDASVETAALAARALGLPHNHPRAVRTARDKYRFRCVTARAGLPGPDFRRIPDRDSALATANAVGYPCVLKPTGLAASQGVLRANGPAEAGQAADRIFTLLDDLYGQGHPKTRRLLVESYLPGNEYALDALLVDGAVMPLALFDKPDAPTGPCFEETLLITPSRADARMQAEIMDTVARAALAIGLRNGPVHAELRINGGRPGKQGAARPVLLELAPRTIGGLCSRSLRFADGSSLEQLVLCSALGRKLRVPALQARASGVLMLPVERSGVLRELAGMQAALRLPGITSVVPSIAPGERVQALPEGDRYLGFVFARGDRPETVEASLRAARQTISARIE